MHFPKTIKLNAITILIAAIVLSSPIRTQYVQESILDINSQNSIETSDIKCRPFIACFYFTKIYLKWGAEKYKWRFGEASTIKSQHYRQDKSRGRIEE